MQPRNIKTIRDFSPMKIEHSKNQGTKVLIQAKAKYQTRPKMFQRLLNHNEPKSLHLINQIKKAESKKSGKASGQTKGFPL